MELADLSLYTDAIACLQQTINEGNKKTNVDIRMMQCQVQHCQAIVQELLLSENEAIYSTSLASLQASLECHEKTLTKKIGQLSETHCQVPASLPEMQHDNSYSLTAVPKQTDMENDSKLTTLDSEKQVSKFTGAADEEKAELQCDQSRHMVIESTIVFKGQVRFSDVVGLHEAKQSLYDAVVMPLMFPHLFSGGCRPWQRILLYGPPGTGKSYLAQAVASEVEATFYRVSSTDLMSSWVGESEKLVKELFQHANRRTGQSVIFIDEIDSLCRQRNAKEEEGSRRLKTELLLQMDRQRQVLLLGATNCPWDLDTAFLRRFQRRIYVSLPDLPGRLEIMKLHCKNKETGLSEKDWIEIAGRTQNYSGSDIATLTTGAKLQPIRELHKATRWKANEDGQWVPCADGNTTGVMALWSDLPSQKIRPRAVTKEDFLNCLSCHHSTVSREELQKYESFITTFGRHG